MRETLIRQMRDSDLGSAMRLKEAESWNQTENDWRFLMEQGPDLCLVAACEGDVVGTVTAINYNDEIAWIGMMLVARDYRNRGVGRQLMESIIERLDGCCSIKLDATPSGARVYRKLGFKKEIDLDRISAQAICPALEERYGGSIDRIADSDIAEIAQLDEAVFGANRIELVRYLKGNLPRPCWVSRHNSKVTGFVLGRKGTRYTHLGPVVAKSIEVAKALVSRVSRDIEGQPALMDVPAQNREWQRWLANLGFSPQRSFSRMFLQRNLGGEKGDQLFAIGGPEIG